MSKKNISIAIDGPAAAGKSTIAKAVAARLGLTYVDTGAMYRAFTHYVIKQGVDPKNEEESIKLIPEVHITMTPDGKVFCNEEDVTRAIREIGVSSFVSYIASYKDIRLALVEEQRKMAKNHGVVMDGRDIGTYVLPDAEVKIFLIANNEERSKRRYLENQEKHIECSYDDIVHDLSERDRIDSTRAFAPLKAAPDAVQLDSSPLTIEETIQATLKIIEEKTGVKA